MDPGEGEVWGYAILASFLIATGGLWLFGWVASTPRGITLSGLALIALVIPCIFLALGAYVLWVAERNYQRRRNSGARPPEPAFPSQETFAHRP